MVVDAPSSAGVRVVADESIDEGVASGRVVTIDSSIGRFSYVQLDISFPRRDNAPNDALVRDRVAYFDDALGRWTPLATRIGASALTASSPVARGRYALVSLNDPVLWSSPTPPATPHCGPAPDWIREVFTPVAAHNTAACVEPIGDAARIRLANQSDFVVAYDVDPAPSAVHLEVIPGSFEEIRRMLVERTTATRIVIPPGGVATVDVVRPADPNGLISFSGAYSLDLGAVGYLAAIFGLAHGQDRTTDVLSATAGDASLAELLAACTKTDAGLAAIRNYFARQSLGSFTDCLTSAVDAAIHTLSGGESLDVAHRRLLRDNAAAAVRLEGLFAYRELLKTTTPVLLLRSRPPDNLGPVVAWGSVPNVTAVRAGGISQLFGVPFGIDAELALRLLNAVLGAPTQDSDWRDGCPLGGPTTVRFVTWGRFAALFSRSATGDEFSSWRYRPLPTDNAAGDRLLFPAGVRFGMTMADVSARLGLETSYWNVFDHLSVFDHGGRQYLGVGEDPSTTIFSEYAEPSLAYCE